LNEKTDLGPMARIDLRDELHDQVTKSMEMGANCILGGIFDNNSDGAYYPPTILTDVKWGSPAYHEELFGPVASIIEASNEKEAIEIANDSFFGLGAAVFTRDLTRGERIAKEEIEAGCCFVNDFVKSDPRLPFGGVKGSGYGRELSTYGIKEFVNIKTVYVK
ncbi:aldehyde dehydrogenase family protein, partial [Fulvivirga lutimaris]|uniref:aldehyde dehydrogenase family protein n=1 Tax=Fulvivirga lutimaris TaxID=1819566 RepID=UPI0012BCCD9C